MAVRRVDGRPGSGTGADRSRRPVGGDPRDRHGNRGRRRLGPLLGRGQDGRSEGDRVFRLFVQHDRPGQRILDHLPDQRDSGRAADQQHRGQLARLDLRCLQGLEQRHDRRLDRGVDHLLELGPGQSHFGLAVRQQHRYPGVGLHRQRVFGLQADLAQPGHGGRMLRVTPIETGQRAVGELVDVRQDRFVEGATAKPLDTLGQAEQLDAVSGAAQHGGVEAAPTQVVHRDGVTFDEATGGRVVRRHRLRLGDRVDLLGQPGRADRLGERLPAAGGPVRRVGERHSVRLRPEGLRDPGHHVLQERCEQRRRRVRLAAQPYRRRAAQAAAQVAAGPIRVLDRELGRGVADQQRAVDIPVHHSRSVDRTVTERHHLGAGVGVAGGGHGRTPEVDSEVVAHDASWVRDVIARSATTGPIPLPVAYSAYCIACARQPIGETCLCWGSDGNIPWRQRLPGGARRPGIGAAPRAPRSALITCRSPCGRWWARPSRWCACWGTGKRWSTAGGRGTDEHNASR